MIWIVLWSETALFVCAVAGLAWWYRQIVIDEAANRD